MQGCSCSRQLCQVFKVAAATALGIQAVQKLSGLGFGLSCNMEIWQASSQSSAKVCCKGSNWPLGVKLSEFGIILRSLRACGARSSEVALTCAA